MDEEGLNIKVGGDASGMEDAARKGTKAVNNIVDGAVNLQKALRTVKTTIDPTYAALERYNKAQAANAELLKAGAVDAETWANTQVKLRQAYDASVAAILRRTEAARADSAEQKRIAAEQKAIDKQNAAQARADAKAEAEAKKQADREATEAIRAERKRLRDEERQAAQQAKQQARDEANAKKQAARETAEAARLAAREKREAEREAAAEAKAAAAAETKAKRDAARAARDAAQAERDHAKAERDAANAAANLRASIDPKFAAQQRYNNVLREATSLLMQNKLRQGEWTAIQKQAKAQMDVNVRSMGRMNSMYVQLGYQAQDVTASLASGINPLVILAQQGGQTAAAMSQMGGTVGRVASFFAGPWGAAIIGFTLLLGYLWQSEDEGKKKTLDLDDAESRRTHTLKELTEALKDYTEQQKKSNNESLIALENTRDLNAGTAAQVQNQLIDANAELAAAKKAYNEVIAKPAMGGKAGQELHVAEVMQASARIEAAERAITALRVQEKVVNDALAESNIAVAKSTADLTDTDIEHQRLAQAILETYRAGKKTSDDYNTMLSKLRAENERYNTAKEKESELHRANAKAIRDEAKEIFQSRQAAIGMAGHELQKEGYKVGENNQFGGLHGYHPGMGKAHGEFAIDVNIPGVGKEAYDAAAKKRMDEMVAAYQARGFRILWNGKVYQPNGSGPSYDIPANENQHRDHVHIEAPQSIVGKPAGSKLANELIRDAERVETAEQKAARKAVEAQAEALDEKKALYEDDLYAQLNILDEKETLIKNFYGADSKEAHQAAQERIRLEQQISKQLIDIRKTEIEQKLKLSEMEANRDNENAKTRLAQRGDEVDFKQSNNLISPQKALAEKARLLEEEYQQQVVHEQRMYELKAQSLRDQLAIEGLPEKEKMRINQELELAEAQHLSNMSTMYQQYSRQIRGMQLQSYQLTLNKFNDMLTTITGAFNQALQGMWMRSIGWKQGMINIADAVAFKFMDMGVKMLTDWIRQQAIKMGLMRAHEIAQTTIHAGGEAARTAATVAGSSTRAAVENQGFFSKIISAILGLVGIHIGGEAAKTGATITGAVTRTVANKAEGLSAIATAVGLAGANGVASWALAPWPIDAGAPAFGAAMAASAAGFGALASAEGGWGEVPRDGIQTELHKKEMVLPARYANPLRDLLTAKTSGGFVAARARAAAGSASTAGSGPIFNYQPNHHNTGTSLETILKKDAAMLRRWMRNEFRKGSFNQ
jgi:hypothetical protein